MDDSTLFYWRSSKKNPVLMDRRSGERGIRTLDRVAPIQHFQCCAFDHSASSPPAFTWGRCECSRAFQSDRMGTSHRITIHWRQEQRTITHDVPEGDYILQSFRTVRGIRLPFSCRNGCCTSCAVRVQSKASSIKSEAMGLSHELTPKGIRIVVRRPSHWTSRSRDPRRRRGLRTAIWTTLRPRQSHVPVYPIEEE